MYKPQDVYQAVLDIRQLSFQQQSNNQHPNCGTLAYPHQKECFLLPDPPFTILAPHPPIFTDRGEFTGVNLLPQMSKILYGNREARRIAQFVLVRGSSLQ